MKIRIVLVVCLWTTSAYAQLQQQVQQPVPPVATKAVDAAKSATEKDSPQSNFSYGPTSIVRNETHSDKAQQPQCCTNTESSKWADPITIFTCLVMVFTGLTWWTYQGILTSTKSIERAYVKMSHRGKGVIIVGDRLNDRIKDYAIKMIVKNWGNTPAQVTHCLLTWECLSESEGLPSVPNYGEGRVNFEGNFLVRGESFSFEELLNLTQDDMKRIAEPIKTHILYIFGYVDYIDKFGEQYRAGFISRYSPMAKELRSVNNPRYNYDCKQKKKKRLWGLF